MPTPLHIWRRVIKLRRTINFDQFIATIGLFYVGTSSEFDQFIATTGTGLFYVGTGTSSEFWTRPGPSYNDGSE